MKILYATTMILTCLLVAAPLMARVGVVDQDEGNQKVGEVRELDYDYYDYYDYYDTTEATSDATSTYDSTSSTTTSTTYGSTSSTTSSTTYGSTSGTIPSTTFSTTSSTTTSCVLDLGTATEAVPPPFPGSWPENRRLHRRLQGSPVHSFTNYVPSWTNADQQKITDYVAKEKKVWDAHIAAQAKAIAAAKAKCKGCPGKYAYVKDIPDKKSNFVPIGPVMTPKNNNVSLTATKNYSVGVKVNGVKVTVNIKKDTIYNIANIKIQNEMQYILKQVEIYCCNLGARPEPILTDACELVGTFHTGYEFNYRYIATGTIIVDGTSWGLGSLGITVGPVSVKL